MFKFPLDKKVFSKYSNILEIRISNHHGLIVNSLKNEFIKSYLQKRYYRHDRNLDMEPFQQYFCDIPKKSQITDCSYFKKVYSLDFRINMH